MTVTYIRMEKIHCFITIIFWRTAVRSTNRKFV